MKSKENYISQIHPEVFQEKEERNEAGGMGGTGQSWRVMGEPVNGRSARREYELMWGAMVSAGHEDVLFNPQNQSKAQGG